MGWDVLLRRLTCGPYRHCNEIPEDEALIPLGTPEHVRSVVSVVFVGTDWSDAAWGVHQGDDGSIEFSIGSKEICESVMLHIPASETVIRPILELCERLQCQALDCGSGVYLDRVARPDDAQSRWQQFRDGVVDDL